MHRSQFMQPRFVEDPAEHQRHVIRAARQEALEAFAALLGTTLLIAAAMGWRAPW